MTRYLIVAHQTVTNPQLLKKVREVRAQEDGTEFVLLVPATPVRHLLFWRGDEHDADVAAHKLGERARTLFAKKGLPLVDVKVGTADPIEAIAAEVRDNPGYRGFIISTLPEERSRWLRIDLPRKVGAAYGLPVHHVVAAPDYSLADLP
jgi:hypothetical protein